MKLSLHITKNYNIKDHLKPSHIRIAVLDQDISDKYPTNYVCILPRRLNPTAKNPNKFQKKFKDQSKKIMKKLLNQALKTDDPDIKKEIRKRLQILNPKPKNLAKCNICGKKFKARRYGYRVQKTCYGCLNKARSSQN